MKYRKEGSKEDERVNGEEESEMENKRKDKIRRRKRNRNICDEVYDKNNI